MIKESPDSKMEMVEKKKNTKNNQIRLDDERLTSDVDFKKTISKLPSHIFRLKKDDEGDIKSVLSEGNVAKDFDITTEDIKGKKVENIFSNKETYKQLKPYWEKAFSGENVDFEIEMKDTWFKTVITPFKIDSNGNVCEIIGFSEDISKKKKRKKKIIKKKKKYSTIFEGVNDAIFLHDIKTGEILDANSKACDLYGYNESELIGLNIEDLTAEDKKINIDFLKNGIKEIKNGRKKYEWHAKNKKGNTFWVEVRPNILSVAGNERLLVTVRDITKQKKAEEKLKNYQKELEKMVKQRTEELEKSHLESERAKNNLKNIIDSANEVIISFDKNNRILTWGKKAEQLTGYKTKEVTGKKIQKTKVIDNTDELINNITRIYNGKPIATNLVILNTKSNSKRIIKTSFSKIKKGNITDGVLLIGDDITHEIESHERFLSGYSYYFLDEKNDFVFQIFKNIVELDTKKGLYITRYNYDFFNDSLKSNKIEPFILREKNILDNGYYLKIEHILDKIKDFIKDNKRTVILLDRIDYLISNFTFERFIKYLYKITDLISENNAILIVNLKSSFLTENQLSILKSELFSVPNQEIDKIQIRDDYYHILSLINKYNMNSILVPFKKISDELSINRKTLSKKLSHLEKQGLLVIQKTGRSKTPYITDKGKIVLNKKNKWNICFIKNY